MKTPILVLSAVFAFVAPRLSAETTYDWPAPGGTLIVGESETVTIQTAADVAAVAALGAIWLDAGSSLVYACADTPLDLSAPLGGSGTFKAASGCHLNLLEDASEFTGGFEIDSTPTCVSNRYGLGSAVTKMAKISRGTCPNVYFFTFGGEGLTNDVPLEISTKNVNGTGVNPDNYAWESRLSGDTGLLVMNALVTFNASTYLYTEDCVYAGGIQSISGILNIHGQDRTANTIVINDQLRTANAMGVMLESYSGGTGRARNPTFVLSTTNFNAKYIDLRRATIRCAATNVFSSSVSGFYITTLIGKYNGPYLDGNIDLDGYDQTIQRLTVGYTVEESHGTAYYNTMSSSKPAVMTLTSSDEDTVPYIFAGDISLRFAGTGAFCLANMLSTSTGTLQVDSGVLQLKWGAGWGGTNVVVTGGTLQLDSPYALKDFKARVSVTGGKFALGESGVAQVKSLTVNGTTLPSNRSYTQADLEELGYGDFFDIADGSAIEVDIREIEVIDYVWSGASAQSAYLDDPDNWTGGAPDLTDGSARIRFGSGAKSPVVRSDILVDSIVFASDGNMTFSSENGAKVSVCGDGIAMTRETADAGVSTNIVSAPIAFLRNDCPVWSVAENVHLRLDGSLSGGSTVQHLVLCGPGSLELAGDNSALNRQLLVSNFTYAAFMHEYALGSPNRDTTFWKRPSKESECYQRYVFSEGGLTNRVPFLFDSAIISYDSKSTGGMTWTRSGEKFVSYGKMGVLSGSTTIDLGETEFRGGIWSKGGSLFLYCAEGSVSFLDTPINDDSGWLNLSGINSAQSLFIFAVPGNVWCPWNFSAYQCTIRCDADNVLCATSDLQLGAGNSAYNGQWRRPMTLDLNGHDQTVQTLCHSYDRSSALFWDVQKGDAEYVTVTSSVPAVLTVTSGSYGSQFGNGSYGTVSTNSVRFLGAAGLRFVGKYGLVFLNHVSDTTGTLEIDSGRVSIEYNAGWGGPVKVSGGTLTIGADAAGTAFTYAGRLSTNAVTMAGGTLELPEGATVNVRNLVLESDDSVQSLPRGYYGSADCADARVPEENKLDCLSGAGVLYVKDKHGLLFIVR